MSELDLFLFVIVDLNLWHRPTTLDNYPAPLETLPLFVRGGAIIPMWLESIAILG